jgi:urease accessory protein
MTSNLSRSLVAAAMVFLTPAVAVAHTGIGDPTGFVHGFGHSISGLDPILAMLMVGVFAWQLGGRALWLVPMTFIIVVAVAGALGIAGVGVPFVETGIALSVVVLGAVAALNVKARTAAAMGIVGLFAIFHGYAHGAKIPQNVGGVAYAAGFTIATALLRLAGIGAGFVIGKAGERYGSIAVRSTGGLATMAGFALLAGIL